MSKLCRIRPAVGVCLGGVAIVALAAGCNLLFGGGTTGTSTLSSLEELRELFGNEIVSLRIATRVGQAAELDIRVDGEFIALDECSAIQSTCNYILNPCPDVIELIESRRFNSSDELLGGARYDTVPGFSFTREDGFFTCGDTLFIDLTSDNPDVFVLGAP